MKTAKDFAAVILEMNHGAMRQVAADLSGMVDKDVRPKIETPQEFADALYDWAEAQQHG